jgi:hypothetical protein
MKTALECDSSRKRCGKFSSLVGCGLLAVTLVLPVAGAASHAGEATVFKLRQVSLFDNANSEFERGQSGECGDEPSAGVKAYPDFKSAKPIYGTVRFGAKYDEPDSGALFHFAVDESGGTGMGHDRLYFDLNGDLD